MAKKKVEELQHKEFKVYMPFSIKEDSTPGILKIKGWANYAGGAEDDCKLAYIDGANEVMLPSGFNLKIWNSNPQILWQHNRNYTVGKGIKATKQKEGLEVEAEIHKQAMDEKDYYKVETGLIAYFSVGFRTKAGEWKEINGKNVYFITKADLYEVSLVSIPCNAESAFTVLKQMPLGDFEGFYVEGDENSDENDYHGEVNIDEEESTQKGDNTMKIQVKDLLEPEKVAELEALGLKTELEQEKEIDIKTYIDSLVDKKFAKFKEELFKKEVEVPEVKTEEEKEAEELAAKEAQEKADKEAEELAAEEAEIKSLSDVIAELKKLTTDEEI